MFNGRVVVTELLAKTLENAIVDFGRQCVLACADKFGFDGAVAVKELGVENASLIRKQMAKKSGSKEPKSKESKKPSSSKKSSIPMPFSKESVSELHCQGIAYNRGLFTQCPKDRMENGDYCSKCQEEADKNASGKPECGCVADRMAVGLYEYKDSKGRKPTPYNKLLEKLKITDIQAVDESGKLNIDIDDEHFTAVVEKSGRGRPKKVNGTVQAEEDNDMFKKMHKDKEDEDLFDDANG
jgi:hypothetical protein